LAWVSLIEGCSMTLNQTNSYFLAMLKMMILLELVVFFALLFGAGWVFGRPLIAVPILLSFIPMIWHISTKLPSIRDQLESSQTNPSLNVYLTLVLGLALILLVVGLVWGWRYPLSAFLFPLLMLAVYAIGPWRYLVSHVPLRLESTRLQSLTLFMVAASLGLLSYGLPMMLGLRPKPLFNPPMVNPPTLDGR
jgi:hypothetical protein